MTSTNGNDSEKVGELGPEARRFIDELRTLVEPMAKTQRSAVRLRWLRWGVGISLLVGILVMNTMADKIQQYIQLKNDYVAVVGINGAIMEQTPASPTAVIPLLEKAFKDAGAKGVIIQINSPGGAPVAADAIRDRIVALREEYPEKEVVVVGEDYMTSGAYLIALGADEIYAAEASNVGSIGVIVRMFGFNELAERYGVERRVLKAGKNKAGLDQWLPLKEEDKAEVTAQLEEIHDWFIGRVRDSRGEKLVETEETFTGKTWLGQEAREMGLIDGIGTLASVAEEKFGTTNVRRYQAKPSLRSMLNPMASVISGDLEAVSTMISADTFYRGPLLMPN